MNWQDKRWQYKGYNLEIRYDHEDDVVKAFHFYRPMDKITETLVDGKVVTKNNGGSRMANLSPYNASARAFELFIDCIEAGADPKGPYVKNLNGKAVYTSWDFKSLQDYAIKFIINGKSRY